MAEIRDLVGQLFMIDFTGHEPSPEVERLIADEGVGGVIVFDKNIAAPRQIAALTNALQEIAATAGRPPLLVSADQEGGPVVRLRAGATHFPSAMAFGAAGSEALAAAAAGITARELRAVGIQMNLAPDVDVNNNPANPVIGVRSYGEDPDLVSRLGVATIRAMQASGVLATAKHFPGHGDTSQDSHLDLPAVPHARRRLEAVELLPFRAAIRAGVGAVLTAHIIFPALDSELRPATLSPVILGLLRRELGFEGLVVTDSMAMRAITDRWPAGEAAVRAVAAGVDIVLACGTLAAQREALEAVRRAVDEGVIPHERVTDAASRVQAAKRRLGLFDRASVSLDQVETRVGIPAHRTVAEHVAEAAVTLVRDRGSVLPLKPGPIAVVAEDEGAEAATRFVRALAAAGRDAAVVPADALNAAAEAVAFAVLFGSRAAAESDAAARAVRVVLTTLSRGPTAVVCVGAPYGLAGLPKEAACIAVYGTDPASLGAAARVLTGTLRARGRLPVTLSQSGEASSKPLGQP